MRLATTLLLVTLAITPLTACSDAELERAVASMTGDLANLQQERASLLQKLNDATATGQLTAEQSAALTQRLDTVAARLAAMEALPPPASPPAAAAPEAPAPVPEAPAAPPPFECVSIFRIQTCEAGVLYQLDASMNWILPGRTE